MGLGGGAFVVGRKWEKWEGSTIVLDEAGGRADWGRAWLFGIVQLLLALPGQILRSGKQSQALSECLLKHAPPLFSSSQGWHRDYGSSSVTIPVHKLLLSFFYRAQRMFYSLTSSNITSREFACHSQSSRLGLQVRLGWPCFGCRNGKNSFS